MLHKKKFPAPHAPKSAPLVTLAKKPAVADSATLGESLSARPSALPTGEPPAPDASTHEERVNREPCQSELLTDPPSRSPRWRAWTITLGVVPSAVVLLVVAGAQVLFDGDCTAMAARLRFELSVSIRGAASIARPCVPATMCGNASTRPLRCDDHFAPEEALSPAPRRRALQRAERDAPRSRAVRHVRGCGGRGK